MSKLLLLCKKYLLTNAAPLRFLHTKKNVGDAVQSVRDMYKSKERRIDAYAVFLLIVPVSAFALGTWQVKRKKWKDGLIADLAAKTTLPPVDFPEDLTEISCMEFHPVRVVGTFDHSKEMYIGPRSLIVQGESVSNGGSIISSGQTGFQVVTPFTLEDRDLTILVNRGWVTQKQKNPTTRQKGQIDGVVELVGVVRHAEERPQFTPKNRVESGLWMYRDLNAMAELTGSSPIFLDALDSSTVNGGPLGGQTRITLRNEHLSYIFTWYGLSAATAFMWYRHFIAGVRRV